MTVNSIFFHESFRVALRTRVLMRVKNRLTNDAVGGDLDVEGRRPGLMDVLEFEAGQFGNVLADEVAGRLETLAKQHRIDF